MAVTEIAFVLLLVVALVVPIARRIRVPYPILLVLGGIGLSFVPGLPPVRLDPQIVFAIFLPPLLYWEATTTSWIEFRSSIGPILRLAVGLVLVTAATVAIVAHTVIPGLSWPIAFVLGAILAPTDEVAVGELAESIRLPRRVMTILGGEGLMSDAASLVAYRLAVAAAVTGVFSLGGAILQFLVVSAGGAAIGIAVGWLAAHVRRRLEDPRAANTITLLIPFAAYIPAEWLHVSGVLAVVAVGLTMGLQPSEHLSSGARVQGTAFWDMGSFLMNSVLFVMTGMQIRPILRTWPSGALAAAAGYCALLIAAIVIVRFVWIAVNVMWLRMVTGARRGKPWPPWNEALLVGWAGIRGGMSFATALAIPLSIRPGVAFPNRDLLLFLAFGVIVVTLVVEGLTIPSVVRWLGIRGDDGIESEEANARLAVARAAIEHLDRLPEADSAERKMRQHLREHYEDRARHHEKRSNALRDGRPRQARTYADLRRELIEVERQVAADLRDEGRISDETLKTIEREIDLDELRMGEE